MLSVDKITIYQIGFLVPFKEAASGIYLVVLNCLHIFSFLPSKKLHDYGKYTFVSGYSFYLALSQPHDPVG